MLIHLGLKIKFHLSSNDFGFICAGVSNVSVVKETPIWVVSYKLTAIWAPRKKFLETYGISGHGNGWRKDALN